MHLVHRNAHRPDAIDAHALHDIDCHHDHRGPQRQQLLEIEGFRVADDGIAPRRRVRCCAQSCRRGNVRRPRRTTSRWCPAPAKRYGRAGARRDRRRCRRARCAWRRRGRHRGTASQAAAIGQRRAQGASPRRVMRPCADVRGAAGATAARGSRDARLQRTLAPAPRRGWRAAQASSASRRAGAGARA